MFSRHLGKLLLAGSVLLACGKTVPPPAPFAPRAGVASDVAPESKPDPQKDSTLAFAAPSQVLLFTENFDVAPGHMIVEQLRLALGGDAQPGVKELLSSTTAIATVMPDPTNQASAVQILKVTDESAVQMWVSAAGLPAAESIEGADVYGANPAAIVAWAGKHNLLMFGPPRTVKASLAAANGGDSLKKSAGAHLHVSETANTMVVLNLPLMAPTFDPLVAAIHNTGEQSTFKATTSSTPMLEGAAFGAAEARKVAAYLPKETVAYVSVAAPDDKTLDAVLGEQMKSVVQLAPSLSSALDAVGGHVTVFAAVAPGVDINIQKADLAGMMLGAVVELSEGHKLDDKWIAQVKQELAGEGGKVTWNASIAQGRLLITAGDPTLASRATQAQAGEGTLAGEDKHVGAVSDLPDAAQGWLWADAGWVMNTLGKMIPPAQKQALAAIPSAPGSLALRVATDGERWRYNLDGRNVMGLAALGGMASAIAIYSVRRYLAASKAEEARVTVSGIAHAAVARHKKDGHLCESAKPVPSLVPSKAKYATKAEDWGGDDKRGWKCLGFARTTPHYYRYDFLSAGATSRKTGLVLEPGHFEAIAEGDLDGDGKTSLFVAAGHLEGKELVLEPSIFIENKLE